ncbi:DUF2877 domain-containing protein [Citrobacter cronae]|uniref:DUF2877 domain-containing protein n=1 Tax=Citrobacter cronae TaxID=1748967 RepID=UPI002DB81BCF|nr:DUF2877 domain-containing protein [Citrobacter cronae]MEB5757204.1 DUF2877 domain-containing protein [Citrobacter cronae]
MMIIRPLMGSQQSPDFRQSWQLSGIWRRSINLVAEGGALLTLHRQGSGFSPGGWVIRAPDFDALRTALSGSETPQAVPEGIVLGPFLLRQPQRCCSLKITSRPHAPRLASAWMDRGEETGLFGPLMLAANLPLCPELRQFRHCFFSALAGLSTDWRQWLGKGPGLTPSHDDTLTGMLLAAWYFGALNKDSGHRFFEYSGNLQLATTVVSVSYLRYAALGYFASPLLHFTHALGRHQRMDAVINSLLALGHTSGADTLLGFWLGQQIIEG